MPLMLKESAAVKKATMRRRPVWMATKGAGHHAAAREWKSVCNEILVNLGVAK
jgi:chromosome partitioning protein